MPWRGVVAIGVGQCVNWGILYYAFAVLLLPVERDLDRPRWVVAGAFSLALLMSAAVAPMVGRWADRGHGPAVMRAGGLAAAALLAVWPLAPGIAALYVVWAGLGLCMAATLYEPAFVIVGRAHADAGRRLRALATVTVFGGLASTVFLPATAILVQAAGWRGTTAILAAALGVTTLVTSALVAQDTRAEVNTRPNAPPLPSTPPSRHHGFAFLVVTFAFSTLASAALTTHLVPALGERGIAPMTAATIGGLFGLMQVPGRALMLHGRFGRSPAALLRICLALQAVGLATLAAGTTVAISAAGIAGFALGSGLSTVVRPHLVQTAYGLETAGHLNGRLVRSQQLTRAAGPVLAAWLAAGIGYGGLFLILAVAFAAIVAASRRLPDRLTTTLITRSDAHDYEVHRAPADR